MFLMPVFISHEFCSIKILDHEILQKLDPHLTPFWPNCQLTCFSWSHQYCPWPTLSKQKCLFFASWKAPCLVKKLLISIVFQHSQRTSDNVLSVCMNLCATHWAIIEAPRVSNLDLVRFGPLSKSLFAQRQQSRRYFEGKIPRSMEET